MPNDHSTTLTDIHNYSLIFFSSPHFIQASNFLFVSITFDDTRACRFDRNVENKRPRRVLQFSCTQWTLNSNLRCPIFLSLSPFVALPRIKIAIKCRSVDVLKVESNSFSKTRKSSFFSKKNWNAEKWLTPPLPNVIGVDLLCRIHFQLEGFFSDNFTGQLQFSSLIFSCTFLHRFGLCVLLTRIILEFCCCCCYFYCRRYRNSGDWNSSLPLLCVL